MGTQVARIAAALCVATLLAACGDSNEREIFEVGGTAESTSLDVNVASCNREPSVAVVESATEIRLKATAREFPGTDGEGDCLDLVHVELKSPVGDRRVVDEVSGRTITLSHD